MKRRPKVALLIETSNAFCRGLLRGIHGYVQEHGPWATYLTEPEQGDRKPIWIDEDWQGDGIIARLENRWLARAVMSKGVPIVDVSSQSMVPKLPTVRIDHAETAKMAAEHLLDRYLRQFGYCGDDRFLWSRLRGKHFVEMIVRAGHPCTVYQCESDPQESRFTWKREEKQLISWLRRVPKPVGVFACHDFRGWQLVDICRRIGISVPDEVAVLGVDNDEVLCEFCDPPLSSIRLDTYGCGYEAARMLDLLMAGKKMEPHVPIKPLGVTIRQSTDTLAVPDPAVSQVLQFIRDHACEGIKVEDVLKIAASSRRVLERQFKKLIGHTLHGEIRRVQFQRVEQLLLETDMTIAAISNRTGFSFVQYLTTAFKERYGMSPREYRERRKK